jgi:hypothetical protein
MIASEKIPEAVWRVAMMTYHREIRRDPERAWQLAIAAALDTWPENTVEFRRDSYMGWDGNLLILPLSTEKNDD